MRVLRYSIQPPLPLNPGYAPEGRTLVVSSLPGNPSAPGSHQAESDIDRVSALTTPTNNLRSTCSSAVYNIIAIEQCNETFVLVSRCVRALSEIGVVSHKCGCGLKFLPRAYIQKPPI